MMATLVIPRQKLRSDDIFFSAMAVLILSIVLVGFAQSYFLAGMMRAKLPNALVHIHGALFTTWIFFLLGQTALVAMRKVRWHIALGVVGVILPPLMIVAGVLTVYDSVRRNSGAGPPPEILIVGDLSELLVFAVLITWGMLARRDAVAHKRLMILGTMGILGPAIDRWHFGLPYTLTIALCLPLLIVGYDLWTRRRVQRSTAWGTAIIFASIFTLMPIARLPVWQACIAWIRRG